MRALQLEEQVAESSQPWAPGHHCSTWSVPTDRPLDFSRPFIAEELTPLAHCAVYRTLSEAERLSYNQLHAFYFNEQVAFFEQEMLSPALRALSRKTLVPALQEAIATFHAEEARHTLAFQSMNLRAAPELYTSGAYHFLRVPAPIRQLIKAVANRPGLFPLIFWLAMIQEERSIYYSQRCLAAAGRLDPSFVALHRAHLADEVGHVRWDEDLLDWLWPRIPKALRVLNLKLLSWMIREFFMLPKRSAVRVVDRLVHIHPRLDRASLVGGLAELAQNASYLEGLYSPEVSPRTFARLASEPMLVSFGQTFPGFRPTTT